tara:strand:- start:553 stop:783 length:231 start_codon:yes stop_codon:yes gene_type:complete
MNKLFLIIFLYVGTIGCAELIAYTIGTASQVSGDLIKETFIDKKKNEKEMILEATTENKTIVIKEKDDECKDCAND